MRGSETWLCVWTSGATAQLSGTEFSAWYAVI